MPEPQGQIVLLRFLKAIWKRRVVCGIIVLLGTAVPTGYSFFLQKIYRSAAIIMPVDSGAGGAAMGLGGLLQGLTLGGAAGSSHSNRLVILIDSEEVRRRVVASLDLPTRLAKGAAAPSDPAEAVFDAERWLSSVVRIQKDPIYPDRLNLIVEASERELVAEIAKQYLVELQNYITNNALTQAKRYRLFLEDQVAKGKEELLQMGKALAGFYRQNPISAAQAKLNVPIAVLADRGVRNFKDYEEFRRYFDVLQQNASDAAAEVKYVQDVPHQTYLKYLVTQQRILEDKYAMLVNAHEMALLEEAKVEPSFQLLEEPKMPRFPVRPRKKMIAVGSFGISLFLAIVFAFWREFGGMRFADIGDGDDVQDDIQWGQRHGRNSAFSS
ncbi:MAG: hypothetical protein HY543_12805 [Deltaproteobacteria bacterium]|nr:hypothetical protein [Deltaproteobacteria bacterium]